MRRGEGSEEEKMGGGLLAMGQMTELMLPVAPRSLSMILMVIEPRVVIRSSNGFTGTDPQRGWLV